jgi:hypothetical protein
LRTLVSLALLASMSIVATSARAPSDTRAGPTVVVAREAPMVIICRNVSGVYSLSATYFGQLSKYTDAHYRVAGPFFGMYPVDPDAVSSPRELKWSVAQQVIEGSALDSGSSAPPRHYSASEAAAVLRGLPPAKTPYKLLIIPEQTVAWIHSTIGKAGRDGLSMFPWMAHNGYVQVGPTRMEFLATNGNPNAIPVRIIVPIKRRPSCLKI